MRCPTGQTLLLRIFFGLTICLCIAGCVAGLLPKSGFGDAAFNQTLSYGLSFGSVATGIGVIGTAMAPKSDGTSLLSWPIVVALVVCLLAMWTSTFVAAFNGPTTVPFFQTGQAAAIITGGTAAAVGGVTIGIALSNGLPSCQTFWFRTSVLLTIALCIAGCVSGFLPTSDAASAAFNHSLSVSFSAVSVVTGAGMLSVAHFRYPEQCSGGSTVVILGLCLVLMSGASFGAAFSNQGANLAFLQSWQAASIMGGIGAGVGLGTTIVSESFAKKSGDERQRRLGEVDPGPSSDATSLQLALALIVILATGYRISLVYAARKRREILV